MASGSTVTFEAGQSITLEENFVAENGSTFTARIQACTSTIINDNTAEERTTYVNNDFSIFPNPTTDQATIQLELASESNVSVALFDLNGRRLNTLEDSNDLSFGTHNYTVDVSNLDAGIYMIVAYVGQEKIIKKLSILR